MSTTYYFYIDEGGLIGSCTIRISIKPVRKGFYLHPYLFGKLPLSSIERHIVLFHKAFPKCTIIFTPYSDITYTEKQINQLSNTGM